MDSNCSKQQPSSAPVIIKDLIKKRGGNEMTIIQGIPMATLTTVDLLQEIRDMDMADQDVIVTGYPKSGCIWLTTITQAIMASNDLEGFATGKLLLCRAPIEFNFGYEEIKTQDKPYAFMTHLRYEMLPRQAETKKNKIIYISRNPKDVAVSFYHFTKQLEVPFSVNLTWDMYFNKFMEGSVPAGPWFDHERNWLKQRKNENVMFIRYEDLLAEPYKKISDIARFIGRPLDGDTLQRITDMTSFNKMKADHVLNIAVSGRDESQKFLRKGKVGNWKELFTEEQSQKIDERYEELVHETGLTPYIFE